ncbi:hypothetical protein MMC21_005329 [Puttea exsequens]|nr:hypothetical protein [Puttea exsequens]
MVEQATARSLQVQGRQAEAALLVWAGVVAALSLVSQWLWVSGTGKSVPVKEDVLSTLQSLETSSTVAFSTKSGVPPDTYTISAGTLVVPASASAFSTVALPTALGFSLANDYLTVDIPRVLYDALTDKSLFPTDCWDPDKDVSSCALKWTINVLWSFVTKRNFFGLISSILLEIVPVDIWLLNAVLRRPLEELDRIEPLIPEIFVALLQGVGSVVAYIIYYLINYISLKVAFFLVESWEFLEDYLGDYHHLVIDVAQLVRDSPHLAHLTPPLDPPSPWKYSPLPTGDCAHCIPNNYSGKFDIVLNLFKPSLSGRPRLQFGLYLRGQDTAMTVSTAIESWNVIPTSPSAMWFYWDSNWEDTFFAFYGISARKSSALHIPSYLWLNIPVPDIWSCTNSSHLTDELLASWNCSLDAQPASSTGIYNLRFNQTLTTYDGSNGASLFTYDISTNTSGEQIFSSQRSVTTNDAKTFTLPAPAAKDLDGFTYPITQDSGSFSVTVKNSLQKTSSSLCVSHAGQTACLGDNASIRNPSPKTGCQQVPADTWWDCGQACVTREIICFVLDTPAQSSGTAHEAADYNSNLSATGPSTPARSSISDGRDCLGGTVLDEAVCRAQCGSSGSCTKATIAGIVSWVCNCS